MATNHAVLMRRELLTRLAKLYNEGTLELKIDHIPLDLRPKGMDEEISRCCIYKDRAMLRYKLMALLGFDIRDEEDELTPLSEYAKKALSRKELSKIPLTVVDEVCSACVRGNYVVTNMCKGCMGRPCMMNCPKDAIEFTEGKAHIQSASCINCGICLKSCPFHAIIYIPVPCEESCPVGAISKRNDGTEEIDYDKCIYCGRCIASCPFGAVMEKSHLMDVLGAFSRGQKVVAMVAPAIAGQFRTSLEKILGAIKQLGFHDIIEVARGANITTDNEAKEFVHKMNDGQRFMTTSCCPSYTSAVEKHIPELIPFVSSTLTPMQYTAQLAREQYPDAVLVFVGPCLAKRYETSCDPNADLMLSFEEIGSMLTAKGIVVDEVEPMKTDMDIYGSSRGYPITNGVMNAVKGKVGGQVEIRSLVISGIDKAKIKEMKMLPKTTTANMIEVMACEGGCINGCNVLENPRVAAKKIIDLINKA